MATGAVRMVNDIQTAYHTARQSHFWHQVSDAKITDKAAVFDNFEMRMDWFCNMVKGFSWKVETIKI